MRLNSVVRSLMGGVVVISLLGMATKVSAGDCTIQYDSLLQRMSGFGGSTAWAGSLADNLITGLFSPTEGCGLTLVRMRIAPNATTGSGEITIAKKAQALGASVWAAPWSPPAEYKDNNNVNNGGSLKPANYKDWADKLTAYAKSMVSQGIDLKWISAQNEPNWTAEYESCRFTAGQLATFVGEHLGPALENAGLKTTVIAPEVINWGSIKEFGDAIMNSATASKYCNIIASHSYGDNPRSPYTLITQKGKELWETEHGHDQFAGDESMTPGIFLAKEMHTQIVQGPISAYHVWWIIPADGVNGTASNGLVMRGKLVQRAYVMGNYSRFVRPGSYRVAANHNPTSGIFVTAYKNDSLGRLVVVAINETSAAVQQNFVVKGITVPNVTPWETSDAVKLTARAQITAGNSFTWSLPAKSVVSFVGSLSVGTNKSSAGLVADKKLAAKITLNKNVVTAAIQEKGNYTLAVYTLQGSLIASRAGSGSGSCKIPLSHLSAGTYLVTLSNAGRHTLGEMVVLKN